MDYELLGQRDSTDDIRKGVEYKVQVDINKTILESHVASIAQKVGVANPHAIKLVPVAQADVCQVSRCGGRIVLSDSYVFNYQEDRSEESIAYTKFLDSCPDDPEELYAHLNTLGDDALKALGQKSAWYCDDLSDLEIEAMLAHEVGHLVDVDFSNKIKDFCAAVASQHGILITSVTAVALMLGTAHMVDAFALSILSTSIASIPLLGKLCALQQSRDAERRADAHACSISAAAAGLVRLFKRKIVEQFLLTRTKIVERYCSISLIFISFQRIQRIQVA